MQIQPPFMVSYSITTKCNLKCKHCYSSSVEQAAPDELFTEEALYLVDDLSRWGIGLLIIDGGEPLCREDLGQDHATQDADQRSLYRYVDLGQD